MLNKLFKKKIKLVTHNGTFHVDDLFSAALLSIYMEHLGESFEIIRSRDPKVIESADYVFDVGGIYDPEKNRFDHHQLNGAGGRDNGIAYSSFGLVWKHLGLVLCGGDQDTWEHIDNKIATPIDASDNGVDIVESKIKNVLPYTAGQVFKIFTPTWKERDLNGDDVFQNEVKNIARVLKREIKVALDDSLARKLILTDYNNSKNKKIVEMTGVGYSRGLYQDTLSKLPEPVYVVFKSEHADIWKIEAIKKSPETFDSRKAFPENWRASMSDDSKLIENSGVSDALFCHRNGFLATAKTKEGAMKLAQIALES